VVVGVLGKMHTYFTTAERDEVAADRAALAGPSLENAGLLRDLILASHGANIAFLNHVASVHDVDKLDLFLQFSDGAYAA
jgi:creatinine amidohydrolase/Fe(II)-dependent formamide hydrolase-like protein